MLLEGLKVNVGGKINHFTNEKNTQTHRYRSVVMMTLLIINYYSLTTNNNEKERGKRKFGIENLARKTASLCNVPDRAFSEELVRAVQQNDLNLMR